VGGNVGLFVNNLAVNCAVLQGASTTTIAVVHKNHSGTTAVAFSAPLPTCAQSSLVWVADQNPSGFVIIPNDTLGSQGGGISVGYGICRTDNVHVISILLNRTALLPSCCLYTVKANLVLAPTVISTDCTPGNPQTESANGTSANVRPTGAAVTLCPCNIPNEASTWGVIKELFRSGS
jgi:hypothetical protein